MIGEEGEAVEAINTDGVLKIGGTLWRARSRRAAPIAVGEESQSGRAVWLDFDGGGQLRMKQRATILKAAILTAAILKATTQMTTRHKMPTLQNSLPQSAA